MHPLHPRSTAPKHTMLLRARRTREAGGRRQDNGSIEELRQGTLKSPFPQAGNANANQQCLGVGYGCIEGGLDG